MKLSVQTFRSVIKEIEVDPESTFNDLREKVRQLYEWAEGAKIILVHKTKILNQTDAKLSSLPQLKDGDRIVVMMKNEKDSAAPAAAAPAATGPAAAAPAAAGPAAAGPAAAGPAAGAAPFAAASNAAAPTAAPAVVSGDAAGAAAAAPPMQIYTEEQVRQLEGMGFEADKIRQALTAAFGNADRAVEYLISGSLPTSVGPAAAAPVAAPTGLQTEAFARAPASGAAPGGGAVPPDALLAQLSQMTAADPNFMPNFLRTMGEQNPQLLQLLEQRPQLFSMLLASLASGETEGAPMPPVEGAGPPGTTTIQLTPAEVQAVNRLCELGFERDVALQAYLACEKNEEQAANFLFDQIDAED